MSTVASALEELVEHLKENGDPNGVPAEEVLPSRMKELKQRLIAAQRKAGFELPQGLQELYEACDGFTDNRYTSLHSLVAVIEGLEAFAPSSPAIWIGDGCGLDSKNIDLLHPKYFKDGEAKIVFRDYMLDFDIDKNDGFKSRLTAEGRKLWDENYVDDDDEEMVVYGPATTIEFLEYVLETAQQI